MRKHKKTIISVLVVFSILMLILLLRSCQQRMPSIEEPTSTTNSLDFIPASDREADTITIPAVSGIYLKAGQLHQTVDFIHNPEKNKCYFQIQLLLSDNTLIWESDYIKPSESIKEIELLQTLERGIYKNCKLIFHCYSLDEKKPLNGGQITLEINSK